MKGLHIKIGILVILVALTVSLFILGEIGWAILVIIICLLIGVTLFRNENILLAFYFLRKGNMAKASGWLNRIRHPQDLPGKQEAYYYYLLGLVESQKNIGKAESYFRKSLSKGLRMKQDQAVAKLNLAGIAVSKRRKREAMILIQDVKKLDKHGMLNKQIKMVQQQMKRI